MSDYASTAAKSLFSQEFFRARAEYTDTPTDRIRAAGRKTRASPGGEDERWWLTNGPQMVQRWIDWRHESQWGIWTAPDGRPAIELELWPTFGDALVKMFIDRIMVVPGTGALVIVDLKSGKRSPKSELQLGFYRAGVAQCFGVHIRYGAYWMARTGELSPVQEIGRFSPGVLAHWLKQFELARQHRIFVPHLSERCRACGVNANCYAFGGETSSVDPDSVAAVDRQTHVSTGGNDG